jgi:hypothetical protein|tara:strand:+ start:279 stop:446 length:168 start_codon:yes stop_codon:yes gene_type:complete
MNTNVLQHRIKFIAGLLPTHENPCEFSIGFVFAKFSTLARNEIIHKDVFRNLQNE